LKLKQKDVILKNKKLVTQLTSNLIFMNIKNLTFTLLFLFTSIFGFGQSVNRIELVSAKNNETIIKFSLNDYQLNKVTTDKGIAFVVNADNTFSILQKGEPDLPKFSTSVIISDMDAMEVKVLSSKYEELDEEILIAPSKGNLTRNIDPSTISYQFGEVYSKNEFYPATIASLNAPFILRDYRAQTVVVNPFLYNPVTKKLRVYTEITVQVISTTDKGENVFNRTQSLNKVENEFNNIYSNLFLNYSNFAKYTPVSEEGNMLIICNDAWVADLADLVLWKNQRGMKTEIVPKSVAGATAAAIKDYVQNYYTQNGLTFLLLVGDAAQIPTNSGTGLGGDSDNAYAYVTGSDHYQEFFVGRFSAETQAQVATQVQRTLDYEKGNQLAAGWLNKTIGIGSEEGAGQGDDGEVDFMHQRNMQIDLVNFTYVTLTIELFDGSQGGNDAAGNATPTQVSTAVNAGAGIITYSGHGSDTEWVTTGFNVANADGLINDNKLPFIWSVACVNGNFKSQTCFAEAWLRSVNGTNPAGSVAMFASTINQSWAPPMIAQDEMIDLLAGIAVNGTKRTFGGLSINGCFQMNEESSDFGMTDTWVIFGDPSLTVRTDDPAVLTVTNQATIIIGTPTFEVNCALEGAFACLSKDGVIIGTAKVIGGVANIPVENLTSGDNLDLVVTGFNAVAYFSTVQVIAPAGAYIVSNGYTISDASANNNSEADYNETFNINITLKNVGVSATSGNVTATILSTSEYVENITNNSFNYNTMTASQIVPSTDVFTVKISNNIPDQTIVSFTINITDGTDNWTSTFNVKVNAPKFEIGSLTISNDTNNDGKLDPAETATLKITTKNVGHANADAVISNLLGNSPYLTIVDETTEVSIDAQGNTEVSFEVEANASTTQGTTVNLTNNVSKDDYTAQATFDLVIGQLPIVTIGEGTTPSANYPFYTYYNNNKTQILYLASEIGAGQVNIQQIAFDFAVLAATATTLNNVKISFMPTNATQLSAFLTSTTATNVFDQSNYVMPTTTGWHSFDIDDYNFDASAGNNLLIEIVEGVSQWKDPFYQLNSTATTNNTVAYGFDDNVTSPAFDGVSKDRPNIKFFNEGEPAGNAYDITFTVLGNGKNPISNAKVTVGTFTQNVDNSGEVLFNLIEGNYTCKAVAPGYAPVSQSFTADAVKNVTIQLGNISSIENSNENTNIKVYPNPSNGIFNIESSEIMTNYKISDLTGRTILSKSNLSNLENVDLSALAKGTYILTVAHSNKIENTIIVIK